MIQVPQEFRPTINTVYPPSNHTEFERWFGENWTEIDGINREYLKIYFCGFQVNSNYGKDLAAMQRLQAFVDSLPNDKKYFTISQYDDSVGVDFKDKDVLIFDMSKTGGRRYPLPLIGQPHPYKFNLPIRKLANFVGNITHPIRKELMYLKEKKDYYISIMPHDIKTYCEIIAQSTFTLCPRGYGANSFRIAESLSFGSIPVYISDEFIFPHNIPFEEYGIIIRPEHIGAIDLILEQISDADIERLRKRGQEVYQEGFTYFGAKNKIIEYLKLEK